MYLNAYMTSDSVCFVLVFCTIVMLCRPKAEGAMFGCRMQTFLSMSFTQKVLAMHQLLSISSSMLVSLSG